MTIMMLRTLLACVSCALLLFSTNAHAINNNNNNNNNNATLREFVRCIFDEHVDGYISPTTPSQIEVSLVSWANGECFTVANRPGSYRSVQSNGGSVIESTYSDSSCKDLVSEELLPVCQPGSEQKQANREGSYQCVALKDADCFVGDVYQIEEFKDATCTNNENHYNNQIEKTVIPKDVCLSVLGLAPYFAIYSTKNKQMFPSVYTDTKCTVAWDPKNNPDIPNVFVFDLNACRNESIGQLYYHVDVVLFGDVKTDFVIVALKSVAALLLFFALGFGCYLLRKKYIKRSEEDNPYSLQNNEEPLI